MLTALALAGALTLPAPALQDPPLTADQSITCAVIMLAFSKLDQDEETVAAFESATGFFIVRAEGMGLSGDEVVDRAAIESLEFDERIAEVPDLQGKRDLVWNHGPGMDRCIDVAVAEN